MITVIAGCSLAAQFDYRIHQASSIFVVEALANWYCIRWIGSSGNYLMQSFIILTDNLSVLSTLQSVNIKSPRVVLWLHNKIQRVAFHTPGIHFCWVPGHPSEWKTELSHKRYKEFWILQIGSHQKISFVSINREQICILTSSTD